ncbi:CMP-N-2CN'-diacetyllegionaminic acid synthase [Mariniflexile rhizosphaerae]|uniref:acylneuraminate cytidylyltransferase family protein n=1 Tax=unclassified Mariniflexile TaxID=2643887 RepID=UPI000CAF74F5|nr:acylneuraminate cytidylyltransferase family protein [Mariniflexile sp. TRM1-10]AXP79266.1 CMP-N-2CN'-diacetyllegionaminic acid synthase [Mariniflexile sp. TRM1-10]PLB17757.1 MAG: N-acylneuraminate cytidylyltransferase [Flavobacteriaceae bacterium FS1-H7996/R]
MKTIAIIPARGHSKRLPNKNIKLLASIPLLVHSINYAKEHDFIDTIYVSTDSKDIKNIALEHGAFVIDRPRELSGDLEPTVTALKHVLESIDDAIENVILLQSTNPLRPKLLLTEAFQRYKSNTYDSLFTVSRNHQKFGTIEKGIFKPFNYSIGQRSQDLEPLYFENGLLYITKATHILNNQIITENAFPLIVDHPFVSIDIDTQEDFDLAEFMINKYNNE